MEIPYPSSPEFIQFFIDDAHRRSGSTGRLYENLVIYQQWCVKENLADHVIDVQQMNHMTDLEDYTWKLFVKLQPVGVRSCPDYCPSLSRLRSIVDLDRLEFDSSLRELMRAKMIMMIEGEPLTEPYVSIDNSNAIYPLMFVFFSRLLEDRVDWL